MGAPDLEFFKFVNNIRRILFESRIFVYIREYWKKNGKIEEKYRKNKRYFL